MNTETQPNETEVTGAASELSAGLCHTPGPWEVMAGDNYEIRSPLLPREYPHHCKEDSTGDFVAYIGNHAADFGEANARLIAAAPDLLAALDRLRQQCNRLRMPGQPKSDAEKNAEAVLARLGEA